MGAVTLIPAAVVLRRLLDRHSYPIVNAHRYHVFRWTAPGAGGVSTGVGQAHISRQMLGAAVFLVWVLRSWRLPENR